MRDYSKTKIYRIICNTTGLQYVGATTKEYLSKRLAEHLSDYKKWLKNPDKYCYLTSFKILEGKNYEIELIEDYPCEDINQSNAREGYWIRETECVNKCVMGRSKQEYLKQFRENNKERIYQMKKEYRDINKEEIKAYKIKYRENNQEKLKAYKKKYREENREKLKQVDKNYYEANKVKRLDYNKEYYKKNKDKIRIIDKEYYEKNKEQISARNKEMYTCECGSTLTKQHKNRHEKSKKHQEYINNR